MSTGGVCVRLHEPDLGRRMDQDVPALVSPPLAAAVRPGVEVEQPVGD